MSGADLAALVVTIASVTATTLLGVAAWALLRTLRMARQVVGQVAEEAPPALEALRRAASGAEDELARVDGLLDRADRVSATLEDASKLTYLAVANPVIKAAALASGVRSGARRLRGGPNGPRSGAEAASEGGGLAASGRADPAPAGNGRRRARREEG